jgi:shikimate dehydrogenase
MAGAERAQLAFPKAWVELCEAVVDVVALPLETPLLALAQAHGKRLITGAEIAVLQALEQFTLYTGLTPDAEQVDAAAAFARAGVAGGVKAN